MIPGGSDKRPGSKNPDITTRIIGRERLRACLIVEDELYTFLIELGDDDDIPLFVLIETLERIIERIHND